MLLFKKIIDEMISALSSQAFGSNSKGGIKYPGIRDGFDGAHSGHCIIHGKALTS
jgi:hypothetical protein